MIGNEKFYMYISTQADWDPAKTIFLCGPAESCATKAGAKEFAHKSGWEKIAEAEKAVLIVPVAVNGWSEISKSLLKDIYQEIRMGVPAQQGKSIWGRGGTLWCWEIILFGVGYADGAKYLGEAQVAMPNFFAATALVDGLPTDFTAGADVSDHWFIKKPSADYDVKNCEIPVQTWIYGGSVKGCATEEKYKSNNKYRSWCESVTRTDVDTSMKDINENSLQDKDKELNNGRECAFAEDLQSLLRYWNKVNNAKDLAVTELVGGHESIVYYGQNPAAQVRVFKGDFGSMPAMAEHVMRECFHHVVRWKNGPDGSLALVDSREEFYKSERYLRRTCGAGGNYYDYFVHLPLGKAAEEVKGLPLVISLHGRGEPAWMYADKNGWESLADETREFVTISADSPGNIWFWDRDAEAFPRMIRQMIDEFEIDPERVYLTGFSNGAIITREVGALYAEMFAALSPWNGPHFDSAAMREEDTSRMENGLGTEIMDVLESLAEQHKKLPVFMIYGDNDPGIKARENLFMPYYMRMNSCRAAEDFSSDAGYAADEIRTAENFYKKEEGFKEPERFMTYAYYGETEGVLLDRKVCKEDTCRVNTNIENVVSSSLSGKMRSERENAEDLPDRTGQSSVGKSEKGQAMVCVTVMKNMPHGAIRDEARAAWMFMRQFRRSKDS